MTIEKERIFEFKFEPAYIADRSFLIYKKVRDSGSHLFPRLDVNTNNNNKRTKPFYLIHNDKKLKVYMDFQGHVRQADGNSLYEWFGENSPKVGDLLLWYKTDKPYEFEIELKRKEIFQSVERPAQPERKLAPLEIKTLEKTDQDNLNAIIKFFELKEKGIIKDDEYRKCKEELLSKIKTTLNNIENLHELFEKGMIKDIDFDRKKKELLSSYGKHDEVRL